MKFRMCHVSLILGCAVLPAVLAKYSLRNNAAGVSELSSMDSFKIQLPTIHMPSMAETSASSSGARLFEFRQERSSEGFSGNSETSSSLFPSLLNAVYLFSSICFIFCLKGLSNHGTSKRGNLLGSVGIVAAVLATLTQVGYSFRFELFFGISAPAVALGLYLAKRVDMIQMPQLIALFHSFVGLAALFVGFSKFHTFAFSRSDMHMIHLAELFVGTFVGAITFIGSLVASGKLSGVLESKSLKLRGKKIVNVVSLSLIVVLGHQFLTNEYLLTKTVCLYLSLLLDLFLGFHLTASIGGADMPVVLSVLNSYSGLATALSGFLLSNSLLIVSGALIASSGAILSYIMCRGMNRDIVNIVLGGWDDAEEADEELEQSEDDHKVDILKRRMKHAASEMTHAALVDELVNARKVVIVPGYGVAVSKCQRELAEISNILISRGIEVTFAIHPVAGRMPGHLNVLLAEANIPYNIVKEMDDVNPTIASADVVLIVGANDTVNPSSYDRNSKIYGMPVIEAWRGKKVVIMKRTLSVGYSAIQNPLFYFPNSYMIFGDAKYTANQVLTILNDYANVKAAAKPADQSQTAAAKMETDLMMLSDSSSGDLDLEQLEKEYPKYRRIIGIVTDNLEEHEKKTEACNLTMVPITPKFIPQLRRMGFKVLIEKGIGSGISISDDEYIRFGGEVDMRENVLKQSNIILMVDPPKSEFVRMIPNNTVCISCLWPGFNQHLLQELVGSADRSNVTYLALDQVPRITRAQKLDIRSSMSNLQGYRAVLEAFILLPKFSKSSITAAGKISPSKVFVIGAGVSGLQAIVTAKSLGCIVYATDPRSATEEEVTSCGGIFVKVPEQRQVAQSNGQEVYAHEMSEAYIQNQRETFSRIIRKCDVVICTASVPGKTSPKLVTTEMIKLMKPGSVAVDLSTEFGDKENNWGGNIECSVSNKNIVVNGIHILGRDKIERNMPIQASNLFAMNIIHLLEEMGGGLQFNVDMNNEIIKSLVVVKDGHILYRADKMETAEKESRSTFMSQADDIFQMDMKDSDKMIEVRSKHHLAYSVFRDIFSSDLSFVIGLVAVALLICILGSYLSVTDLHHLFLFALSSIVGYYCVWSVTPSLHTPLMSVTNALSGVIIIGAMMEYGNGIRDISTIFSILATLLASINLSGGFYVTKRMLDMFSK